MGDVTHAKTEIYPFLIVSYYLFGPFCERLFAQLDQNIKILSNFESEHDNGVVAGLV